MPVAPLSSVRIVDLSQQLPGPYATALLASLGATVIKVEPPQGDAAQEVDPVMYERLNATKTIERIDLKTESGKERLWLLVDEADVFLESFRPGVATRLGFDHDSVAMRRPDILYCSLSGYGQSGPLAATPAHDINTQATAGGITGPWTSDRIGVPWVDLSTGMMMALSVVSSLHAKLSGYLDLSMLDMAMAWIEVKPAAVHTPEGAYGAIESSDGELFAYSVLEDGFWSRLCVALNWEDWLADPSLSDRAGRQAAAHLIRERIQYSFGLLSGDKIRELAESHDLPFTSADPAEKFSAQQRSLRRAVHELTYPVVPLPN